MSNFSKEQLYKVYEQFLSHFTELAQISQENHVGFEFTTDNDGEIMFSSRQYFYDDKNRTCVKIHRIQQGKLSVSEESKTVVLKENKPLKN